MWGLLMFTKKVYETPYSHLVSKNQRNPGWAFCFFLKQKKASIFLRDPLFIFSLGFSDRLDFLFFSSSLWNLFRDYYLEWKLCILDLRDGMKWNKAEKRKEKKRSARARQPLSKYFVVTDTPIHFNSWALMKLHFDNLELELLRHEQPLNHNATKKKKTKQTLHVRNTEPGWFPTFHMSRSQIFRVFGAGEFNINSARCANSWNLWSNIIKSSSSKPHKPQHFSSPLRARNIVAKQNERVEKGHSKPFSNRKKLFFVRGVVGSVILCT